MLWVSASAWASPLLDGELQLQLHADGAAQTLQQLLSSDSYWQGAWRKTYNNERYDEIRLKEVAQGFIPMIAGEGGADVSQQVAADVVFSGFDGLPAQVSLVKGVRNLGHGHDDGIDADYTDTAFLIDGKLLYLEFVWRIYRRDLGDGRRVLWFEALPESSVPVDTLARYRQAQAQLRQRASLRSSMFGSVVAPSELFGVFIIEPGTVHRSRVTFVARVAVGKDAGWVVQWGSQLPLVLRAAMRAAFDGAVNLAIAEARRRGE